MIIELLGAPGSGKTTLLRTMLKQNHTLRGEIFPYFRNVRHVPFFLMSILIFFPSLAVFIRSGDHANLTRRDIALMAILTGWPIYLKRRRPQPCTAVVLEEGALCLLAKLHAFGFHAITGQRAMVWWNKMHKQWAETLDMVIHLDTSAPELAQRVRSRRLLHEIDTMTDEKAASYLDRIRGAQATVLSDLLLQARHPYLVHFDTAAASPAEICKAVMPYIQDFKANSHG
jgi:ABC-type cobalamin/Fe3+-siderophores transport system ATPase subunit